MGQKRDSNAQGGALKRVCISPDVSLVWIGTRLSVNSHGSCIFIALRVAAEAKFEKYNRTGDDQIFVLNRDHWS